MQHHLPRNGILLGSLIFTCLALSIGTASAASVWDTTSGDWHDENNWVPVGVPGDGVAVSVGAGANILLNAPTAELASFEMSAGTLTFTNWNTSLSATNVLITGGNITLPPPFVDDAMSNRVWIVCDDFTLLAPGTINVEGRGYAGGANNDSHGHGPGRSMQAATTSGHAAGPGYGGLGGDGVRGAFFDGGTTYGSADGPAWPGSGSSGSASGSGSAGGGAVQIDASGHVIVSGTISAIGVAAVGPNSAGGSGGGIHIACSTFTGTNGFLRAEGRNGGSSSGASSGGGRIAVDYNPAAQAALPVPDVRFSAAGGRTSGVPDLLNNHKMEDYLSYRLRGLRGSPLGEPGTLYFPDNRFLVSPIIHSGVWTTPVTFSKWDFENLTVSNAHFRLPISNVVLTVTNRMSIIDGARFELPETTLNVGGDLVISNAVLELQAGNDVVGSDWITEIDVGGNLIVHGSTAGNASWLYMYAGATNSVKEYGATITVASNTIVGPHGWIRPLSHPFNGGSPFFDLQNLTVNAGGGFDAARGGYRGGFANAYGNGTGYGAGFSANSATGAGHGGLGGRSRDQTYRGLTYGNAERPINPGSGGGGSRDSNVGLGGRGGGLLRIEANQVVLNGTLSANGSSANVGASNQSGGGSGGGILLACREFSGGATGALSANGGHSGVANTGGGGGGRIAVIFGEPLEDDTPESRILVTVIEEGESFPGYVPYDGIVSVTKGTGYTHADEAEHGTIRLIQILSSDLSVTAEPATLVGARNATLHGRIGSIDAANPEVYFCWGYTNAGTVNTSDWANVVSLGDAWGPTEAFSYPATGLDPGSNYVFVAYVNDGENDAWSGTESFTTIDYPAVVQLGATNIGRSRALLRGAVTSTGGEVPQAGFAWWPVGGSATSVFSIGTTAGPFEDEISGLEGETEYAYQAWASNDAGIVWSDSSVFETLSLATQTYTWEGTSDNHWLTDLNWDPVGIPGDGDMVIVTNGANILLSTPTADLAAFEMTGGTLTFTNWNTALSAANVLITGGNVTLPPAFRDTAMSNRVWIVCDDFSLIAPAMINVEGRGYAGGASGGESGHGPGRSLIDSHTAGPGYGGRGGDGGNWRPGGMTYGTPDGPAQPGSGGAGSTSGGAGGAGGGAVQIEAANHALVSGTISANGGASGGSYVSGGSGGGIHIACATFAGTNGNISATGRNGGSSSAGSGGGRIAVIYDTNAQANLPVPGVRFSVARGTTTGASTGMLNYRMEDYLPALLRGGSGNVNGQLGTLYFPDNRWLVDPIVHDGVWITDEPLLSWNLDSMTVSNVHFHLAKPGLALTVTHGLSIIGGARFELTNAAVNVGGDLVISNAILDLQAGNGMVGSDWITEIDVGGDLLIHGSTAGNAAWLYLTAGATNGVNEYGARVTVAGNTIIGPHGWIRPLAHPFNGGSPFFDLQNLIVNADGGFDAARGGYRGGFADANGYGFGYGQGHSTRATGAGYGGRGGRSSSLLHRGATYGTPEWPAYPGSGGGGSRDSNVGLGGRGGGLLRIEANQVVLDGTLNANGSSGNVGAANYSGGGSGGGILLACREFSGGATGTLTAQGGNAGATADCGGGGGGRIAVAFGELYRPGVGAHRLLIDAVEEGEPLPASLDFSGTATVAKGAGHVHADEAEPGTMRFIRVLPPFGTLFKVR